MSRAPLMWRLETYLKIQVPNGANVTAQVANGSIRAERIGGDVTLRSDSASLEARDIDNAHVHAHSVSGPITLANISSGHVEVGTGRPQYGY